MVDGDPWLDVYSVAGGDHQVGCWEVALKESRSRRGSWSFSMMHGHLRLLSSLHHGYNFSVWISLSEGLIVKNVERSVLGRLGG